METSSIPAALPQLFHPLEDCGTLIPHLKCLGKPVCGGQNSIGKHYAKNLDGLLRSWGHAGSSDALDISFFVHAVMSSLADAEWTRMHTECCSARLDLVALVCRELLVLSRGVSLARGGRQFGVTAADGLLVPVSWTMLQENPD